MAGRTRSSRRNEQCLPLLGDAHTDSAPVKMPTGKAKEALHKKENTEVNTKVPSKVEHQQGQLELAGAGKGTRDSQLPVVMHAETDLDTPAAAVEAVKSQGDGDLCAALNSLKLQPDCPLPLAGLPAPSGTHTRFTESGEAVVQPASKATLLRGLPSSSGSYIKFAE